MQDQEFMEIQLVYQLMMLDKTDDTDELQDIVNQIYTYTKLLNEAQESMDHEGFMTFLKEKYLLSGDYTVAIKFVETQML